MTIPGWLSYLTPWWLVHLINRALPVCWINLAAWKLFHETRDWRQDWGCRRDAAGACYCGKYHR